MSNSASAEAALAHLKAKQPLGGWSVEHKLGTVRLLRRKIPVTDAYFLDIHHDPASGKVVGILAKPQSGKAQAQVLCDETGKLVGLKLQIISVSYDPSAKPAATARPSVTNNTSVSSNASATANTTLTDEQNKQLMQYALYFLGGVMILRIIAQTMFVVSLLLIPAVYVYALQTCPDQTSFDAKKELRRILRGHHLPENHRDKPRGWLDQAIARVNAAVTTELATGLGYEVTMMSLGGAGWFTTVRVPTCKMDFYWIGGFDKWIYIYSQKYEDQATS